MGSRSPEAVLGPGEHAFAVVRLDRAWEAGDVAGFISGLNLRKQIFVKPHVNPANPTEIVFASSDREVAIIRSVKDDVTPGASRALVELVAAGSIQVAMNAGLRRYI